MRSPESLFVYVVLLSLFAWTVVCSANYYKEMSNDEITYYRAGDNYAAAEP